MRTLFQDVRFGLRVLRNSPGFTLVAVATLALGISTNTTVFNWVDNLLLHPFPGSRDSDRLAVMQMLTRTPNGGGNQLSWLEYRDFQRSMTSLAGLAVHREEVFNFGDVGSVQPVWGELVSGDYFAVLGMTPVLGRVFTTEEQGDKLGAWPVAVISHALWRSRFHGDRGIVGRTVRVNRHELTIVGVAPAEFRGTMPGLAYDLWVPLTMGPQLGIVDASMFRARDYRNLYALVRLKPGIAMEQASAEAASAARNLARAFPRTNRDVGAAITPPWQFRSAAPDLLLGPLRILMAVCGLVLLIVCANVANLLLARAVARQKEFGIRVALGASRFRLARQLLLETLLLALPGALIGLVLAFWMADSLPSLIPHIGVPVAVSFQLNGRILAFIVLLCMAAALISGAAPALFSASADVNEAIKEGGRGGTPRAASRRTRGVLVIAEIALAAVALIGAGLFTRSFRNARAIHPGFERSNVLLGRFYLSGTGYSGADVKRFCAQLRDRLQSAPGVADMSYADFAPLGSNAGPWTEIEVEGYVPAQGEFMTVSRSLIGPDYLRLLRIPLLEGRNFTDNDDVKTPPVVLVNEAFARRYFHGGNPVGRRIRWRSTWHTVVGLVKDSKYFSVAEAPRPFLYGSFRQRFGNGGQLYVFLRTDRDPLRAAGILRAAVTAVDPAAGSFYPMPLADWTELNLLPQKVAASMLSAMGIIALLLAAVGLYSVMAYSMSQRIPEIGIRMALGATRREVVSLVLRQGLGLTLIGLALGVAAALAVVRVIAGMLVNVSAADPITFAAVPLFLAAVAALACFAPAWRATRVDPITALRTE